jgi:hypothetical protein
LNRTGFASEMGFRQGAPHPRSGGSVDIEMGDYSPSEKIETGDARIARRSEGEVADGGGRCRSIGFSLIGSQIP